MHGWLVEVAENEDVLVVKAGRHHLPLPLAGESLPAEALAKEGPGWGP